MGLVAVTATQMWHQTFIGGGLADLPLHPVRSEEGGVRRKGPNGAALTNGTPPPHFPLLTPHS